MNEVLNIESNRLKKEAFKNLNDFQNKIKQNFDSGYKEDLYIYLEKIYMDVLPSSYFKQNSSISSLLNDPEDMFDNYFENLFDELHNQNNNELKGLKNKIIDVLRNKYNEIKKKIKETDKDIQLLEEIYIQSELKKKISFVGIQEKKFEFKDRQILHFHDYKFSELSCRYLFSTLSPFHENQFLPHLFYPSDIYSGLLLSDNSIRPFQEYHPLLKYWLYYILCIENIYKKNIDVDAITSWKNIYELSKKIRQFKKKDGESKKKKNKKKKKQRGGLSPKNIQYFKEKKGYDPRNKRNDKKNKTHQNQTKNNPEFSKMTEFLKKIVIYSSNKPNKIISLHEYFNGEYCINIVDKYYQSHVISENQTCVKDISYPLLFKESENIIKPSLFIQPIKKGHNHGQCYPKDNFIDSLKKNIKVNQVLYNYDETKENEMKDLGKDIYKKLCMFYLSLYFKKKFIYSRFISIFDKYLVKEGIQISSETNKNQNQNKFSNQNNQNQNSNQNNQNTNQNTNQNKFSNQHNQNENNQQKINSVVFNHPNMENKYQLLQKKIEFLENKKKQLDISNEKYDEKVLTIDKYIRDLKIQKQNIRRQN